jgi:hypothetical protein
MSKIQRSLAAALLAAGLTIAGQATAGKQAPSVADAAVADFVTKRVAQWQPTAAERVFDDIAWVKDIREALRLSRQHNRPVFLFTHDGRMNIGRC